MPSLPDAATLEALRAYDTPTICNALELVAPARRATGFTRRPLFAAFPQMKPVVAFARTAMIRSREPHPRDRDTANRIRLGYYEHIAAKPLPSIAVIQDIDAPDTGFGAFWGEVQTHVHKGLGCAGVITDGSVRDLDAMAPDFLVLAGSVMPSHAHVHLVDFGGTVSVAGMLVTANDVIHADRHGAVVIPSEAVEKIAAAVDLLTRREKVIIDASKRPGFSIEHLRQAYKEQDDIH
ncbi:MAG: RraA family protein [Alphaproteobacteria bacterium]|nr:RraA family protein [Alphaproteobacteria bacterium]MBV9862475.1 RraA family protein [Alphaproteobacteria bacterium]